MKKNNKKKGFTLIELLAVIVVLAIVAVLGASLILPALANARKSAFVTEANNFLEGASNGVNLVQVHSITSEELSTLKTSNDYSYKETKTGDKVTQREYCFTLTGLIKLGLFSKKTGSDGKVPDYDGRVVVTVNTDSKMYTYTTTFSNKDYYVTGVIGNVKDSDVNDYGPGETFSSKSLVGTCSNS